MANIAEIRQQYPQYKDMSDADLGAALHKKYYSDMPFAEFSQKVGLASIGQEQFGPETERQMMKREAGEDLDSYKAGLVSGASGITSGTNDELMAGISALGSVPITGVIDVANRMGADIPNPLAGKGGGNAMEQVYSRELAANREQNKAATEGHSYAAMGGTVLGALANPINKVLPTGGGIVNNSLQGLGLGVAQGLGEGEGGAGNRIVSAATTGLTGAALGGAIGVAGAGLKYLGKKTNPAPTVTKLKEISDKAFQYIDDSKFKFSADDTAAMSKAMDDVIPKDPQILQRMAKTGNESISAKGMFDEIYAGKPTSLAAFRDFDSQLTDKITGSYSNFKATSETSELYKLQNAIRGKMDEAMANATPAVRDAYYVYSQKMKVEDLGNILDRAMKTQNPASSLKTQLANYARKARGLDDAERKLINDIIKDDLGDEALRSLGSRLAGIGQVAQGNFGQAMGQVALSKLSRNTLEARKLAKIDNLINYIARKAESRISTMGYLDIKPPELPKYPKLDDVIEKAPPTRGGSQGIRSIENPNLKTKIPKKD